MSPTREGSPQFQDTALFRNASDLARYLVSGRPHSIDFDRRETFIFLQKSTPDGWTYDTRCPLTPFKWRLLPIGRPKRHLPDLITIKGWEEGKGDLSNPAFALEIASADQGGGIMFTYDPQRFPEHQEFSESDRIRTAWLPDQGLMQLTAENAIGLGTATQNVLNRLVVAARTGIKN